jgi:TolA-binding protein
MAGYAMTEPAASAGLQILALGGVVMRKIVAASLLATTACLTGGLVQTAHAQNRTAIESRVDRLEGEMKAVQRKVFPGGAGATVEPQITAPTSDDDSGPVATGTPITDLTQRVGSLEGQVQTLTGQIEQNQYRLRQLEDAFNAYKRSTDARIKALEETATATGRDPGGSDVGSATLDPPPVRPTPKPTPKPTPTPPTPAASTPAPKPTGTRAAQVAAVEKPDSGDKAEDGYLYGYRLWQAKLYPEARKELEAVSTGYPKHRRASYAQNLLGRAYLDAGAPSLAAVAFYENYKKNPNGERAPDSLYYLAKALTALKKSPTEICKVYTELTQLYGDRISEEMKAGVSEGRATNKCK